jgi:putative pyruvate formate lyase activating enzyme
MAITRRQFLHQACLVGSSFFLPSNSFSAACKTDKPFHPAYGYLEQRGELKERIQKAYAIFEACELCPRTCGVNRLKGEKGFCRAPADVMVYSAQPHYGEEKSLVGKHGSGTIFFSNCNLRCVFCQNWPIAHKGYGKKISDADLADMMLELQKIGCHNINLVTPTHVMPNILKAVQLAYRKGLRIPLVYNTSGYERTNIVKLLDGIVDIYLPDMKYMDQEKAALFSASATDYPEMAQQSIIEMHRQVKEHTTDSREVALRGLMIRHLVMPNRVAGTEKFVKWLASNLPKSTYVNIMAQYHVDYKAYDYPEIWRRINVEEYLEAMNWAKSAGLTNLDLDSLRFEKIYKNQREAK